MQMCEQSTMRDLALPAAHFPIAVEKTGLHPTKGDLDKYFWKSLSNKLSLQGSLEQKNYLFEI